MKLTTHVLILGLSVLACGWSALAAGPLSGDYVMQTNDCMPYYAVGSTLNLDQAEDGLTVGKVVELYGQRGIQSPWTYPTGNIKRPAMCGGHCFFRTIGVYSDGGNSFAFVESDGEDEIPEHTLRTLDVVKTPDGVLYTAREEGSPARVCVLSNGAAQ